MDSPWDAVCSARFIGGHYSRPSLSAIINKNNQQGEGKCHYSVLKHHTWVKQQTGANFPCISGVRERLISANVLLEWKNSHYEW